MSQFWPEAAGELSPVRRWYAAGELMVINPYFATGLTGGGQYLPTLLSMPPMRRTPTIRRADGTTGLHTFSYLSTSAAAPATRSIRLDGSSASSVAGLYSSSDNGGLQLLAGFMLGTNVNPVWLDAS